ncbi:melatonin receptor type 1C-like [Branchiostoma lanceolatum]|uniref:melatonin receptor type 1C-like n=1 Tax=Branchiostoma lanceolatum TaxID=7740 RepID=UPI003456DD88
MANVTTPPSMTRAHHVMTRTNSAVTRLCLDVGQEQLERLVDGQVAASKAHVTALLVLVCAVGTIGNLLVVLVSARRRKQSSAAVCLTSLAAVDLLICGVFVPHKIYHIHHVTYTGALWCKVNPYFMTAGLLGSTFLLDAIAVDRYRAVCRPLRYCTTK